jgi:hypothetical protein
MSIVRFPATRLGFISVAALLCVRIATPAAGTKCVEPAIFAGSVATEKQLSSTGLKVVSLNMAREERLDRILRDLRKAPDLAGADVWLLQEAVERPDSHILRILRIHSTSTTRMHYLDQHVRF